MGRWMHEVRDQVKMNTYIHKNNSYLINIYHIFSDHTSPGCIPSIMDDFFEEEGYSFIFICTNCS